MSGRDGPAVRPGTVYLVGAGPGDPSLITVRGAELLARAEVVVHDRLVDAALLDLASPDAVRIDVGKRPGDGLDQQVIHDILASEAIAGRSVVRLKGGDPFVYGRGGEECQELAAAGIPFEVVPGISSAVAAPAYAGIPLTHREHSSWVAIATGTHVSDDSVDWGAVARAPTVVVLMAVGRLDEITRRLAGEGRDPATPAALVSWASWPSQRTVRATLATIAGAAEEASLPPPAVLVVGDVAGLGESLDWFDRLRLRGCRVLVTRASHQAGRLSQLLRRAGAEVVEAHAIRIEPAPPGEVDSALRAMHLHAWAAFTSANAVTVVGDRMRELEMDARVFGPVRIAAVGPATAEALGRLGLRPDLVPTEPSAAGLARELPSGPGSVAFFCAENHSDDLVSGLQDKDRSVVRIVCYRTVPDAAGVETGRRALAEGVDAVLFASASAVRAFAGAWEAVRPGPVVCCIGPRTADEARAAGMHVDAIADEPTLEALVSALVRAVGR